MSLYVKVDGNQHRLKLPASATKTEIKAILGLHGVAGVFYLPGGLRLAGRGGRAENRVIYVGRNIGKNIVQFILAFHFL